jgi:hypothetical protein
MQITAELKTMESCANLVNKGVLEELISLLPEFNTTPKETDISGIVLSVLARIAVNVFNFWDGIEKNEAQERLQAIDGFNVLFKLFNTYSSSDLKERLAIVLAVFHTYKVLPSGMHEIVGVLKSKLIECLGEGTEETEHLYYVLSGIASLARQTNEQNGLLLYDEGILPLVLGLFVHKDLDICRLSCRIVMNFCMAVKSTEARHVLIGAGLFTRIAAAFAQLSDASFVPTHFPHSCVSSTSEHSHALSHYICLWFLGVVLRDLLETCAPAVWVEAVAQAKLCPVLVQAAAVVYRHCPLADADVVRQAKTFHEKMAVALLGQITQTLGDIQTQADCNNGGFVDECVRI